MFGVLLMRQEHRASFINIENNMVYKAVIRRKQRCRYITYTILCCGLVLFVLGDMLKSSQDNGEDGVYRSRHILQDDRESNESKNSSGEADLKSIEDEISNNSACKIPSIAEFPRDLFTNTQRKHGAVLIHLLVAIYMCVGLATVCDYYFVPSLEVLCYKLKIQPDVAGASLMAIGSSAPELCASIIGVFVTKGDIGIGTILGSAVFNLLFVVGACGIVAVTALQLSWWSLTRDTLCYCLTLVVLAVVIFDGHVNWPEAVCMFCLYILYLIFMSQNQRIEKKFYKLIGDKKAYLARFNKDITTESTVLVNGNANHVVYGANGNAPHQEVSDNSENSTVDSEDEAYPDDPPRSLFFFPESIVQKIGWVLVFPLELTFFLTIPDLRRPRFRKWVAIVFIMSITWIGLLTYTLVWMVTVIGFTIDIPDSVMGLTFVAFGSSVPDGLASVIVAKQGKGDMAVSQTLGSNVFDILLGLGLPWMIKGLMDTSKAIKIQSEGMLISCFITFILAMLVLLTFYIRKFVLGKRIGIALIVTYAVYLVIAIVIELVLHKELPLCEIY